VILAICSPAMPGAAEAVSQSRRRKEVKVIGLGLPNDNKRYVKEGITDCVILWNTHDLGYAAVQAAFAVKKGTLQPGVTTFKAGKLPNELPVEGDNIILGKPMVFNNDNIDQFDF
jgi:ABC-type sugar transport system substrate-binding protein